MKINFTVFNSKCTGGNRCIFELANGLLDKGHDVIVTAASGDTSWFPLKAEINILNTPFKYPSMLHMGSGMLKLAMGIPKADVQIATWCFTPYPIKLHSGVKIYRIQHYEPLFWNSPIMKYFAKKSYHLGFKGVVNSTWCKKKIMEEEEIETDYIPNGIDTDFFKPLKKSEYGDYCPKKEGTFRIISLAKDYIPWKGLPDLIESMKIVDKEIENTELLFYGVRGPKGLKYPHTFVKFPSDEELVKLYNSADLVVCPSHFESFPLPPLEAMATGTPIVTTKIGTEDYAEHGKNSMVVPPKSPQIMADRIIEVLDDQKLRMKLSRNGVKTAKEFSWDKIVDKFNDWLKNKMSSG